MKAKLVAFGCIKINGKTYEEDVVIEQGEVKRRKKKASKPYRKAYGHTPLSAEEPIPWNCKRLVIGTGMYGRLPVMDAVHDEAKARGVKLVVCPTDEACALLSKDPADTNAILHVTC